MVAVRMYIMLKQTVVSFTLINLQLYDNGKRRYLFKRSISFLIVVLFNIKVLHCYAIL